MSSAQSRRDCLDQFSNKLKVPAVVGGVLYRDGTLDLDAVGVRRRGSPGTVTLTDQWHIGSCGKSMTAVLFAMLVEKGITGWGVSVAELFPDLRARIHPGWADRTIDDIFHCRSGMRANPSASTMKASLSDTRPLNEQRTDATLFALGRPPGPKGRFVYSNLGYMVVGAAIDRLASTSYEQALDTYLLKPLGVSSLGFGPPPDVWGHGPRIQLGGLCVFRGRPADPFGRDSDNPKAFSSAGTMHLTMQDWSKFLRLFLIEGGGLLKPATITYLLTVPPGRGQAMAMGWVRAQGLGRISFGMQGSNTMWSATVLLDEQRQRASLVVVNDGRTRVLTRSAVLASTLLLA